MEYLQYQIRTDASNAFAHLTMTKRVPSIIRDVQRLNPDYPEPIQRALDALHDAIVTDQPMQMIDLPAPDYEEWETTFATRRHETWLHSDWFFTEVYFYRLLIQIVRWWETGRDPFAPHKHLEVNSVELWKTLDVALMVHDEPMPAADRLAALLQTALWGNRIDLSYAASAAHGGAWGADDLLVDDRHAAVDVLLSKPGDVHFICDNAGTELAVDLALTDTLLNGIADKVVFHLKLYPQFVSDSMPVDVLSFLDQMESGNHGEKPRLLAQRLRTAWLAGRWQLAPDLYWNSARFLWDMPSRLTRTFEQAALVIMKGDLNYRKAVGDALWPVDKSFAEILSYFPAPLLVLRTLKSDTVIGLPSGTDTQLYTVDKDWRINGKRGVIQFKGR
ncbi:MAG: protein-glutamate O-methyltransferase family protein [Anaerolineae bacterium]|nr:protein-glutamate O-methyltransferase family protein [Anaerolineae bacterium]